MPPPATPKIYHIVHVDRLPSIIVDGCLWCDEEIARRAGANQDTGTTIGMSGIKQRRLTELTLDSHSGLYVGQCVPFYFCPRSVMLYVIHRANRDELSYLGGQGPILHLEADLHEAVRWANANERRWAFTLSNAGSYYFKDRADLAQLDELDWTAINAQYWQDCKEPKAGRIPLGALVSLGIGQAHRRQLTALLHRSPGGVGGWKIPAASCDNAGMVLLTGVR